MAMTVTTVSLPNAEVGVPYSVTLTETGGVAPITWAKTAGTIPTGLSLTGAVLSGTPTGTISATPLTFKATDSTPTTPQTASSSGLTLTIDAAIAVSTTSLPNAVVGTAYSQTLAATGGVTPLTWTVTSGTLPAGLSLAASTGIISGTPTKATTPTAVTFTVTDAATGTASQAITFGTSGSVQPVGIQSVGPLSFPLMPQCWPLTSGGGNGNVASVQPQQNSNIPAAETTALAQAGESNDRLV